MDAFPALTPLPTTRPQEAMDSLKLETEGFVDEEIVRALISGPPIARTTALPADLALSSGDDDFAGWPAPATVAAPSPFIAVETHADIHRRPAPPVLAEEGLEQPHLGGHRWWVAAMAGLLTTLCLACLLLVLSQRPAADSSRPGNTSGQQPAETQEPPALSASIR